MKAVAYYRSRPSEPGVSDLALRIQHEAVREIVKDVRRHAKPVLPHPWCNWAALTDGNDHIKGTLFHSECCLSRVQVAAVVAPG
jgi:hypothetical protein